MTALEQTLVSAIRHHRAGNRAMAEPLYRAVLKARPDWVMALHALAMLLMETKRDAEAVPLLERASTRERRNAALLGDLGRAYLGAGRPEQAITALGQALRLDGSKAEDHRDLGEALLDLGRAGEAAAAFEAALARRPDFAEAINSLGVARFELRDLDKAIACFQDAIARQPGYAEAANNLGAVLYEQNRLAESERVLRDLVACSPDYVDAHYHLAATLLKQGNFAEGWAEYEYRRRKPDYPALAPTAPEWRGEPLDGKTILLTTEQGLGDILHFIRFAAVLAGQGARVIVEAPRPLVRLLATAPGVAEVIAAGTPRPPHDFTRPLMSLPLGLGIRPDGAPQPPYLAAAPFGQALPEGPKVGIVWAGAPRPNDRRSALVDRRRSLTTDRLAPLLGLPGITFVSLQKGAPPPPPMIGLIGEDWDFADTAALVAALDLVIAVDTSTAHLAGALGKPVWILSRFDGCWRWLVDRDDSPWYPSATLFRQPAPGDWDTPLSRMADRLATFF